jgi:nucleotide-binding universal stress UspA family protein
VANYAPWTREELAPSPGTVAAPRLIVCGTDFGVAAGVAVEGTALVARRFGARVVLVHVVDDPALVEASRVRLLQYAQERLAPVPVMVLVRAGRDPAHELARVARSEGADLIAIGVGSGRGPLVQVGVEADLIEEAPCPVIVVGAPVEALLAVQKMVGAEEVPEVRCTVCGQSAGDTICFSCRARISWQAMDHKWEGELHEGRGLMGLGGRRAVGPVAPGLSSSPDAPRVDPPPPAAAAAAAAAAGREDGNGVPNEGKGLVAWLRRWRARGAERVPGK